MNNFENINQYIAKIKNLKETRIDDKFIVVHPKHYQQIKDILDEGNIVIDVYQQNYCDIDKVYLIDKP